MKDRSVEVLGQAYELLYDPEIDAKLGTTTDRWTTDILGNQYLFYREGRNRFSWARVGSDRVVIVESLSFNPRGFKGLELAIKSAEINERVASFATDDGGSLEDIEKQVASMKELILTKRS